jgi:hypothetical protein
VAGGRVIDDREFGHSGILSIARDVAGARIEPLENGSTNTIRLSA